MNEIYQKLYHLIPRMNENDGDVCACNFFQLYPNQPQKFHHRHYHELHRYCDDNDGDDGVRSEHH